MKHSTIAIVGKQEQVPRAASLGGLARLLPGVCIAIGITLFFWPNTGESNPLPKKAVNPTASHSTRTRPIESLCVGDRVLANNPEVLQSERDTFVEPDWTEWLHLSLAMPKANGSLLEIELLRPESWVREQMGLIVEPAELKSVERLSPLAALSDVAQHVATSLAATSESAIEDDGWRDDETHVDSVPYSPLLPMLRDIAFAGVELQLSGEALRAIFVEMDLPELAITGEAIVLDIRGPPPIRPGDGRVVTATFHHSSGDVIDLVVGEADTYSPSGRVASNASGEGSSSRDAIGTTSNHPFWSVDRQAYVQAGQLRIGERLHTYSGDTKRVISKLARPGPQPVYNLEVFAEHVYYVGQDGLLVHNAGRHYTTDPGAPFGRKIDGSPKAKPGPKTDINAPQNAMVRAVIEEQTAKGLEHIGGGRAAGVGNLAEIEIITDGGFKSSRRMDASFRDPVSGKIIHFQIGQKNRRGDPVIREREALLDVIRRGKQFKSEYVIKFREYKS